ncbi:MAG: hypothetical protein HDR02_18855 [Lachnospiraceae bacterium]|nr:hypothetical protein [Lachnospiraceae bacterium]
MKRRQFFAMGMIMVCILGGCGNVGGSEGAPEDSNVESEQSIPGDTEPEQSVENSTESSVESSDGSTAEETLVAESSVELSEDEKTFFTDFIQERENYGFLLSEYDAPEDVNLGEVLYGGAGFGEGIPEEDIPLYLAQTQQEEVYTDCTKMTRQDIEDFLQRKLGVGLEDMSRPLEMVYVDQTDAYYNQAGDTNYAPFACTGGTRQGDTYTLHFTPAADWFTGYGDCETVLVKTGDDYRFISNRVLE